MAYSVYMHTNKTNGKKYIGITGQKYLSRRWHNGEGYKKQRRFYSAIKSYGWDNFTHEVLFDGLNKDEAERKEAELIAEYRSNTPDCGYNIENGGVINKLSEEQKTHLRNINLGKRHTEETKAKMRLSSLGKSSAWLTGRVASKETREKMGRSRTGARNGRAKSVVMFDSTGNLVKTFATLKDAANAVGACGSAHISDCCRGKKEMAHGYRWAYKAVN